MVEGAHACMSNLVLNPPYVELLLIAIFCARDSGFKFSQLEMSLSFIVI